MNYKFIHCTLTSLIVQTVYLCLVLLPSSKLQLYNHPTNIIKIRMNRKILFYQVPVGNTVRIVLVLFLVHEKRIVTYKLLKLSDLSR